MQSKSQEVELRTEYDLMCGRTRIVAATRDDAGYVYRLGVQISDEAERQSPNLRQRAGNLVTRALLNDGLRPRFRHEELMDVEFFSYEWLVEQVGEL